MKKNLDVVNIGHLPGRCRACGFYIARQGHRKGCPELKPRRPRRGTGAK